MNAYIRALEYKLPDNVLTNKDLEREFPGIKINDLTRLTGVEKRYTVNPKQTAADLAFDAAEYLFEKNNIDRDQIDFLIYCTSFADYLTPPTSCILQDRLNLKQTIGTYDYNQGCTGYIYGLSQAKALIESEQASNILLLTGETITKRIHKKDKSNRAIFGDGAAATLISAAKSEQSAILGDFVFGTDGSGYETIIIKHGGARYPYPETKSEDYRDSFGNVRNDGFFYMNGSEVFIFSAKKGPELTQHVLNKNKVSKEDVKLFILHQANRIILETIFKKLKIRKDQEYFCLKNQGNTVQSTIPIALKEAVRENKINKGDKVMLGGFGVGFSWAGTVVEF